MFFFQTFIVPTRIFLVHVVHSVQKELVIPLIMFWAQQYLSPVIMEKRCEFAMMKNAMIMVQPTVTPLVNYVIMGPPWDVGDEDSYVTQVIKLFVYTNMLSFSSFQSMSRFAVLPFNRSLSSIIDEPTISYPHFPWLVTFCVKDTCSTNDKTLFILQLERLVNQYCQCNRILWPPLKTLAPLPEITKNILNPALVVCPVGMSYWQKRKILNNSKMVLHSLIISVICPHVPSEGLRYSNISNSGFRGFVVGTIGTFKCKCGAERESTICLVNGTLGVWRGDFPSCSEPGNTGSIQIVFCDNCHFSVVTNQHICMNDLK